MHRMELDEIEDFIKECSRLLEESQPARRTPNPRPSTSRPDEDDTLQIGTFEVDESSHLLHMQRLGMAELRHELAQKQLTSTGVDKVFLGSLSPMEYAGESDFEDDLSQFEAMARTLCWNEDRKDSALYSRLKGKALTCMSSCPNKKFSTLVDKLRDRLLPKDDKMFYQQLMTYRKKPDHTWENLTQEIEVLSIKTYRGMEERFRDSMAAKAFVEAVIVKQVRRKVREKHPRTINDVVKYAWMIEADQLRVRTVARI